MKSNNNPLVSIITPSYNQGCFIEETINSVLSQSYKKIEYIIIDGGSTDETLEILKRFGDSIKWVSEPDDGQAHAVNKGFEMARGEIIGWLNSDDVYVETSVSKIVTFFMENNEVGVVYGQGHYISKSGKIVGAYETENFDLDRLSQSCIICQPAAFFRKQVVDENGGLDTSLDLCMDYEFWIRLAKSRVRFAHISDFLAMSRMYEDNKTMSRRVEVHAEACRILKILFLKHASIFATAKNSTGKKSSSVFDKW